ncbi:GntR family transcriptional regulator [candidate division KSB3 bacterium]|uniref:GntR family transcriptional regulator n=1 Tax=candidate division KSB3 bacterium TaxID=2044937 RepID=A0A2G6E7Q9_9BACT|nr:MAG: GntR family transcriptional regulator [candidate division KSB3 bacterium]PIE30445.1 MAG: GntR family transcriptional regulator [candidate division KSB3 bacterium]
MSSKKDAIHYFEPIELRDPADSVIQQIKDLISSGRLKSGDKLPSEQKLEERFGISRAIVRRALKRLDAYGIVKTVPQSGTYVAGLGLDALGGLLSNVLELEEKHYEAVVEARYAVEAHAVRLATERISPKGLEELDAVHRDFSQQMRRGVGSLDEDLVFHLKIAEFAANPVLKALITILASDVIKLNRDLEEHLGRQKFLERRIMAVQEHQQILDAMHSREPEKAVSAMQEHYQKSKLFREHIRETLQE